MQRECGCKYRNQTNIRDTRLSWKRGANVETTQSRRPFFPEMDSTGYRPERDNMQQACPLDVTHALMAAFGFASRTGMLMHTFFSRKTKWKLFPLVSNPRQGHYDGKHEWARESRRWYMWHPVDASWLGTLSASLRHAMARIAKGPHDVPCFAIRSFTDRLK
jgi:hypothetical protein